MQLLRIHYLHLVHLITQEKSMVIIDVKIHSKI